MAWVDEADVCRNAVQLSLVTQLLRELVPQEIRHVFGGHEDDFFGEWIFWWEPKTGSKEFNQRFKIRAPIHIHRRMFPQG